MGIVVREITGEGVGPFVTVEPLPPTVRIAAGPTYLDALDVWEVTVNLPVYSGKLAYRAYRVLPLCTEIDGRVYYKDGMRGRDCVAWYRSRGK